MSSSSDCLFDDTCCQRIKLQNNVGRIRQHSTVFCSLHGDEIVTKDAMHLQMTFKLTGYYLYFNKTRYYTYTHCIMYTLHSSSQQLDCNYNSNLVISHMYENKSNTDAVVMWFNTGQTVEISELKTANFLIVKINPLIQSPMH